MDRETQIVETSSNRDFKQLGDMDRLRITGALVAGVVAATVMTGLMFALLPLLSTEHLSLKGIGDGVDFAFAVSLIGGPLIAACWLVGIFAVGLPCWRLLHRVGYRGRMSAAVLGLVSTSLSAAVLSAFSAMTVGQSVLLIVPAGVVAALVIWHVAYRQPFWARRTKTVTTD